MTWMSRSLSAPRSQLSDSPRSGGLITYAAARWVFAVWVILVLALYFAQFEQYWNRLVQIVRGALPGVA